MSPTVLRRGSGSPGLRARTTSPTGPSVFFTYSFSGLGTFHGFTIYDNEDAAGLRFQEFSYNSVSDVPEPMTLLLLGLGLGGLALRRRA